MRRAAGLPLKRMRATDIDCLVIGGGVTGWFTVASLQQAGRSALLIERTSCGNPQTSWCQGILHAGTKYSLSGVVSSAAAAADSQVESWRAMLGGTASPDLSRVAVRTRKCHLWRTDSLMGRVGLAAAGLALKVSPRPLGGAQRPAALGGVAGDVFELDEWVIDTGSLLSELARLHPQAARCGQVEELAAAGEGVSAVVAASDGSLIEIRARTCVLTAGDGNESLRRLAGLPEGRMQRRPLRQALVRGPGLSPLWGHCIDGMKTAVTVTSAHTPTGLVWSVGGEVAEQGARMSEAEFAPALAAALARALPRLELSGLTATSRLIDRAEEASGGQRPDGECVLAEGPFITVWPTKLVLAPQAAQRAAAVAAERGEPVHPTASLDWSGSPGVGRQPWEESLNWSPLR